MHTQYSGCPSFAHRSIRSIPVRPGRRISVDVGMSLPARRLFCVCRIDCDSYGSDEGGRKEHGEERLSALFRLKAERRTIRISDTESLVLSVESFPAEAAD